MNMRASRYGQSRARPSHSCASASSSSPSPGGASHGGAFWPKRLAERAARGFPFALAAELLVQLAQFEEHPRTRVAEVGEVLLQQQHAGEHVTAIAPALQLGVELVQVDQR